MADLLSDLKRGTAQFTMLGTAKIGTDTFKGVQQPKEGGYWVSVKTSIPVEINEGVRVFPEINDGYMSNKPIIKKFPSEKLENGGMLEIPFKNRLDKAFVEKVGNYDLFKCNIEKDEDGKPIMQQFIHGIDFEKYLSKHMVDGMEVRITGNVEYGFSKDREKVYRNYRIKAVYLNEGYKKNGEDVEPAPHSATFNQTYLVEAGALDSRWEKDLEGKGKTTVTAYVPDYMSKVWDGSSYVEFKKTVALPQALTIAADISDEKSIARGKVLAKRLFDVPKKKVREINLTVNINEGFETGTPDFEVSKDLQELIDAGLMTLEDVTKQVTVRGNRISELVLVKPRVKLTDEGNTIIDMTDDKYSSDVLIFPSYEMKESNDQKVKKEEIITDDPNEPMSDDAFDALFGMED
ncbi:hypothetical protein [Enterococcus mundtii]|uniref:hypothetical protein n=1 Tax=Enterococcus mundtii TaxID=53346 RepID=UPI001A967C65|nr:hypothetical protein [Enterococcus mundtii]MBO1087170.1 hypothetical protein [Enterococcus mundtii]